eukprot:SM000342S12964  [mRNA]  locus=s342:33390:34527:+ [translate_table: standard]
MRPPAGPCGAPGRGAVAAKREVSHSYILMVQHLIERCLLLHMDQEECAKTLAKYASVKAVITNTVWKELEKENKEFFLAYAKNQRRRAGPVVTRLPCDQERSEVASMKSVLSDKSLDCLASLPPVH